jgi:hypothetical protein
VGHYPSLAVTAPKTDRSYAMEIAAARLLGAKLPIQLSAQLTDPVVWKWLDPSATERQFQRRPSRLTAFGDEIVPSTGGRRPETDTFGQRRTA